MPAPASLVVASLAVALGSMAFGSSVSAHERSRGYEWDHYYEVEYLRHRYRNGLGLQPGGYHGPVFPGKGWFGGSYRVSDAGRLRFYRDRYFPKNRNLPDCKYGWYHLHHHADGRVHAHPPKGCVPW